MPIDKDLLQIFGLLLIIDCVLTVINFCFCALTMKMFTEIYKVRRLMGDDGAAPAPKSALL